MANEINNTSYQKLKNVLKEVFQLDQADLDFGIYRIMNQKRDDITDFLDNRLLPQVKDILAKNSNGDNAKTQKDLDTAIEQAKGLGIDPNSLPKVQELQKKLANLTSTEILEQEVYSHMANFFKRYYKDGDFISLRRYKKNVYAIPYQGEEVKLHWANHDQYYIKTSEHLKNYGFKLSGKKSVKIELKEASTEQNNNKEESGKERRFKIYEELPVEVSSDGNTVILNFTYEQHNKSIKQDKLISEALNTIVFNLPEEFNEVLTLAPTEKNKKCTLLEKHLNDFSARNTFDYFIHKDLGGFLSRELDFYIKNEVLYLDDINTDKEQDFTAQLSKIKALKQVAQKIITFLAQLENFQKKLWLKKKFVVSTNYCITLDKIPEKYYTEIRKNKAQLKEWKELFKIHKVKTDLLTVQYTEPLSLEFLKSQPFLVLDTKYFSEEFKNILLAEFDDLDKEINGLLINSENFQALSILRNKYIKKIKASYIDPPYNTAASEIVYKNDYKHSSWASMMDSRLKLGKDLLSDDGFKFITIDYAEFLNLGKISDDIFGVENRVGIVTIYINPKGRQHERFFSSSVEYMYSYAKNHNIGKFNMITIDEEKSSQFNLTDDNNKKYRLDDFSRIRNSTRRNVKPNFWYPIYVSEDLGTISHEPLPNYQPIYPINNIGEEYSWKVIRDSFIKNNENNLYVAQKEEDGSIRVYNKFYEQQVFKNIWTDKKYFPEFQGTNLLKDILGNSIFSYPKSIHAVYDSLKIITNENDITIDYFAGSGTTGHAVLKLNRVDNLNRKFILVEMGKYFDLVTKPRIQKVIYSDNWKNGEPLDSKGISHMFKYQDLESYEDVLNNLTLQATSNQSTLLANNEFNDEFKLKYMLDVESRDSLLNIDAFKNPFSYKLNITRNNESQDTDIDLVETFNYLIGLHVKTIQTIKGFKVIIGVTNERKEETLIIWRNTEEKNNKDLNEFFSKMEFSTRDTEFQRIYVNGDNHLENLKIGDEKWKVVLIEEEFTKRMFDVQDV